ncbi:MAG: ATP-dependent RNA helicase HrpA [Planctomycetota bacterium]
MIGGCLAADRRRLSRRLRGLDKPSKGKKRPPPHRREQILREIAAQAERSIALREKRAAAVPKVSYPDDLPIAQRRDDIAAAIRERQVVVVCGETGSGKTTQLPKICLELGRGIDGAIGHTQPRRLAARSVADRVAEELGVQMGTVVGSKVRFGDQTRDDTLVKLMTDGILLAETQSDRFLDRYDTIIVDEAHERSLNIDFLLGYLATILPRRPDLKLIVTSATIDPERFAEHFADSQGPAPIIEVSGRAYPVEVRYRPLLRDLAESESFQRDESDMIGGVLDAIAELDGEPYSREANDVLVFMPGEREIRETANAIRRSFGKRGSSGQDLEVLPLYARLSSAEQQRIFKPHRGRRIVIATNVAETSLTVPGIKYVIDPGTARISRYSARSKVQGLPIEPISQASANQRKGRCGRVAPGVCFRLYSEDDFNGRDEFTQPEILRTSLANVVLQMAALRLGSPEDFPFVEAPDRRLIRDGYETLLELGAVDEEHQLTEIGKRLARLPVDPRIGRMILAADEENCLAEVLVIASGLTIQDPRERPTEKQDEADAAHERYYREGSDFLSYLELWKFYHDSIRPLSRSKRAKACRQNFLSDRRMHEWAELVRQLRDVCSDLGIKQGRTDAPPDAIHRSLLTGLLTSVGRKSETHEYEGVRGTKFAVHPSSQLFKEKPQWLMAAELVRTTKLYARCCARIQPQWIESIGAHLLKRTYSEPRYVAKGAKVLADEKVTLLGLEVIGKKTVNFGPIDPAAARRTFIHHALVEQEHEAPVLARAECLKHNAQLIESVRKLEDKARRRDLLAETEAIHDFYDGRLPADVYSADKFEKARKKLESKDRRALFMSTADVLAGDPEGIREDQFPERVLIGESEAALAYRFDPEATDDGVTLELPPELVARIDPREAERLVPGWLPGTIEALVRTLPKSARRRLDIPDVAARLAPKVIASDRPMLVLLADEVAALAGVRVTKDDFRPSDLPNHLKINYRAIDADGEVIAESREIETVQAEVRKLGKAGAGPIRGAQDAWSRDGLIDWDFDELPETVEIRKAGRTVVAFPGLVDEGASVSLHTFETPEQADRATRLGLARLFAMRIRRDFKWNPKREPGFEKLILLFSPLGDAKTLESHLTSLVARELCVEDRELVRDSTEFDSCLDSAWDRLAGAVSELFGLAQQCLSGAHTVLGRLEQPAPESWNPARADVNDQLGRLMHPEFLKTTPIRWLRCYPRFLKAAEQRLERLRGGDVTRDRQAHAEIRGWLQRFDERVQSAENRGVIDPALDEFGWLLQEYRVALFAQNLRTSVPVSSKRLDRAWEALRA